MVLSVQMTSFHMPDSNIVSMPNCSMPNYSMPDASMPNSSMPDASMPDASMPDLTLCKDVFTNLHCGQIVRVGLAPLTVQHPVIMIVSGYKLGC